VAAISNPGNRESALWLLRVDGENPPRQFLTTRASQRVRGLTWLPGQMRLVVGLAERTSDIVLFDQGQ
jgi:hypothetical protein